MENKKYLITGDTHGRVLERLANIQDNPSETALIILGDAGLNFFLNKTDAKNKAKVQDTGFTIYCVRGNHEERPSKIKTMRILVDEEIQGRVYYESEYPNIRYLIDGCEYKFGEHSALILGGAYSVDKYYRLKQAEARGDKWSGWFEKEQLSMGEMINIATNVCGRKYDLVLTHTCPFDWRPTDLFLSGLDQSKVDNSMEIWMNQIKDWISWKIWLFGHYHDDRLIRPRVEMYYRDIEDLETVWSRWMDSDGNFKDIEPEWWLKKDPNYYL